MKSLRILVIEEDTFFAEMLVRFIREIDSGMPIEPCAGAFEDLFAWRPDVLLLAMDNYGLKTVSRISQARGIVPQAFIIAMGKIDDAAYRELAVANGANDFINKRDIPNTLFPIIDQHLNRNISL